MDLKDLILVIIALIGWIWAIVQFFLTREYQKKDKALEKRFDVYSTFMDKIDEMNKNMRNDPKMVYGISEKFMQKVVKGNDEDISNALIEFNTELMESVKLSIQPTQIISQELNKLKLICSNNLLPKIEEYKLLSNDFSEEFQITLNSISANKDLEITQKELTNLGHSKRGEQMGLLWKEIESMMREEIGYYKNV